MESIDDDTKLKLLPAIQYYQNRMVKRERFTMRMALSSLVVFVVLTKVLLAPASYVIADELLNQQHFNYIHPLSSVVYPKYLDFKVPVKGSIEQDEDRSLSFLVGSTLMAIAILPYFLLRFLAKFIHINAATNYVILALIIGSIYLALGIQIATMQNFFVNQRLVYILTSGLLLAGKMSFTWLFLTMFCVLLFFTYDRRHPDALIVDSLIKILGKVEYRFSEYELADWESVELRKDLVNDLEQIAVYINFYLPGSFRTNDSSLNLWQQKMALQMATAVRSWKKWLYTPMPDTREHFVNVLSFALVCAASGNWDEFPKMELEDSYKATSLRERVNIIFSKLFRVSLPLLLFLIFQQTPFRLQGDAENYVKLGVFGIAALTLLTEFDPNFNARVSLLKEIINLIPGTKKG